MKVFYSLFATCLALSSALNAQTLIDIKYESTAAQATATSLLTLGGFSPLTARNDIDVYDVLYTMDNLEGRQDTVSGLLLVPGDAGVDKRYPTLVYQHGTTQTKFDVPTDALVGFDLSYVFATQGYIVFAPDFLNMGQDQEGFHPYVHARTEALAAINMIEALESDTLFADARNDQLFLTGYSQGGHASMALHEILIEEYASRPVTAAGHMSGPYSVSDIMLDEVALSDDAFAVPAFIPYTVTSYQAVYGNLYNELADIYKAPFIPHISAFIDGYETGAVELGVLNEQLHQELANIGRDSITYEMFLDSFVNVLPTDMNNPFRAALRDNDTYDFVNPTPTRLYYCTGDEQVNFRNSLLAADSMNMNGASDTEAVLAQAGASHGGCVNPATRQTLSFFEGYRQVISSVQEGLGLPVVWSQHGAELRAELEYEGELSIEAFDPLGRKLLKQRYFSGDWVELDAGSSSWVVVRLSSADGRSVTRRVIVR